MYSPEGYREKEAVRTVLGELVTACLWYPEVSGAKGETAEHLIEVWRDGETVRAEVKHKPR